MKEVTLGRTGIKVPQNGFGALPIQRVSVEEAVKLLRKNLEDYKEVLAGNRKVQ